MRVLVVLPVFNEAASLGTLLARFDVLGKQGMDYAQVVIVDDGSDDQSAAIAESFRGRLPIEILRHATNQGLGKTMEDGLSRAAALASPQDAVVTMDADNTHPPELIPRMLETLDQGADVVIASRYRTAARVEGLSWFRSAMSYGARIVFQALLPVENVRDYTCGFRVYRAGVLQRALEQSNGRLAQERGFACMAEILLNVAAAGARFEEVPFVLNYDLKGGASKMNVGATAVRILRLALRQRFRRS